MQVFFSMQGVSIMTGMMQSIRGGVRAARLLACLVAATAVLASGGARAQQIAGPDPAGGVGSILGVVVDAAGGAPLAGAHVAVEGVVTIAPIVTGIDGVFEAHGVPAGERRVGAFKEGYLGARVLVNVVAGERTAATIALQPAPEVEAGVVAGVVADRSTGSPIAGARVFFLPARQETDPTLRFLFHNDEFPQIPHVVTGADGRYRTPPLPEGDYHLRAGAPGFEPDHRIVSVEGGAAIEADFGLVPGTIVPPEPGGPAAVQGLVVDAADGRPILDAAVHIRPHLPPPPDEPVQAGGDLDSLELLETPRVNADGQGFYRIRPLLPAGYELIARAPGYRPDVRVVGLRPGQQGEVIFRLMRDGGGEVGSIGGVVLDRATRAGIAGAAVIVSGGAPSPDGTFQNQEIARAVTGSDGRYEIPGVPAGVYRMVAMAEGYASAEAGVEVVGGGAVIRDFALEAGGPAPGGGIRGIVANGDPRLAGPVPPPIAGATVRYLLLQPEGGVIAPGTVEGTVTTDANGGYAIPDLPAGPYLLQVSAEGFLSQERIVPVGPGGETRADFLLAPEDVVPVGAVIEGTVVNGDPNLDQAPPIAGARVVFTQGSDADPTVPPAVIETRTDERGRYRMEVPSGAGLVEAEAAGFQTGRRTVSLAPGQAVAVDFSLLPVVQNVPAITGVVVGFAAPGTDPTVQSSPVAGATIFALVPGPDGQVGRVPIATTNAQGEFAVPYEVVAPLLPPPGEVGIEPSLTIRAEAPDYLPSEPAAVTILPGHTSTVAFTLIRQGVPSGPLVAGRVTTSGRDPNGTTTLVPVAGARVEFGTPLLPTLVPLFVTTNANGEYEIPAPDVAIAIPSLRIDVTAQGFLPAGREVQLVAGQTVRADFTLQPQPGGGTGSFAGRVVSASDGVATGISGATVVCMVVGSGQVVATLTTGAEGGYETPGLPAGEYFLRASAEGFEPMYLGPFQLAAGQRIEVNFPLAPRTAGGTGAIVGRVVAAGSETGIPGATVLAYSSGQTQTTTTTGADGRFEFPQLPAGSYHVRASADRFNPAYAGPLELISGGVLEVPLALTPLSEPQ